MARSITPAELYAEIDEGRCPYILDVRNQDEYATWQIEGTRSVPMKNVPIWVAVEESEVLAQELPEDAVVVCAHGNGSDLLLDMLAAEGKPARNLQGGTAAWAELLVSRALPGLPQSMVGWQIQRPAKACLSYLVGVQGKSAVVVDPARFAQFYIDLAASQGMTITHVIDTHVHADHITGGPELAELTGAAYHVPIEDTGSAPTPFANSPLPDGAEIDLGDEKLQILSIKMPGHTPGSTCINLPGHFLLTGDTVFVRGVGRPDLTGKAEELAKELFHTVHDRLKPLDPKTMVLPAHWTFSNEIDSGGLVETDLATIFQSTLLNEADMVRFVEEVITSLPSAPDIYDTIRLVNSGRQSVSTDEIEFLEIGKNQCAASTTT